MVSEPIDIREPVARICASLGLKPSYVHRLDITPGDVKVVLYKGRDGRCKGFKYITEDGEPAMETVEYEVLS